VCQPTVGERQARCINADALPKLHLPLIGFLRDLFAEIDIPERIDRIRRIGHFVDVQRTGVCLQRADVRFPPLTE
jgi:hypothetical protein